MISTTEPYTRAVVELIGWHLVATGNCRDNPAGNVGAEYVNNVFEMRSYNWDDEAPYAPNFYFVEYDYTLNWYKHLGRGDEASRSLTTAEAIYMLNCCLRSIDYEENVPYDSESVEWDAEWDREPDEF